LETIRACEIRSKTPEPDAASHSAVGNRKSEIGNGPRSTTNKNYTQMTALDRSPLMPMIVVINQGDASCRQE
jgi:hypothetical protein